MIGRGQLLGLAGTDATQIDDDNKCFGSAFGMNGGAVVEEIGFLQTFLHVRGPENAATHLWAQKFVLSVVTIGGENDRKCQLWIEQAFNDLGVVLGLTFGFNGLGARIRFRRTSGGRNGRDNRRRDRVSLRLVFIQSCMQTPGEHSFQ